MDILETTLRDGSYTINFQFTARDTAEIAAALEKAGFRFIEIGHGVGLGASRAGQGEAAETDEGYMRAAADALTKAKFGMFCIPGIASLADLDAARDHGMGFLRVGTNVTEVETAKDFIERAKKYGMFVAANFMKSYASSPWEFAERAKLAQEFGADIVYVVDSCGGMMPADVEAYFQVVRDVCDVPLAFHGHDNLGMSVANSLHAVELGAQMVDTSLQGLGRSAGNAPTEILLVALARLGIDLGIDPIEVMDIGEKFIRPMIKRTGLSSIDIVSGYAQFHSAYMGVISRFASKYGVDPRILIIETCRANKVHVTDELVEDIAKRLQAAGSVTTARYEFHTYFGHEESIQGCGAEHESKSAANRERKHGTETR